MPPRLYVSLTRAKTETSGLVTAPVTRYVHGPMTLTCATPPPAPARTPLSVGPKPDLVKESLMPSFAYIRICLLYTSPSPRDQRGSRMPSSA